MPQTLTNLLLGAVQETLRVAKRQTDKQRPIENIDPQAIVNRYLTEKVESFSRSGDSYVYLIVAMIESDVGLEEAEELDVITDQIREGFTAGFDQCETGQYTFEVEQK